MKEMTAQVQGDLFGIPIPSRVAPAPGENRIQAGTPVSFRESIPKEKIPPVVHIVFSSCRLPGMDEFLSGILVQEWEYEYLVPAAFQVAGKEAAAMKIVR